MIGQSVRSFLVGGAVAALSLSTAAAEVPAPAGQVGVPYQLEVGRTCGGGGSSCSIDFPVTPAKRRVDLEQVTCGVQGTANVLSIALLLDPGEVIAHELILDQTIALGGGESRRLYDQQTGMSVSAGRHAAVSVLTATVGAIGIRCTLFGTLVFLP